MVFVPEAALIALREGLEAFLVTGIMLGLVLRLGRPDVQKHVWLGFGAAAIASVALGIIVQKFLYTAFEEGGGAQWFELIAASLAVVLLTYMIIWMWKHTRDLVSSLRARVQEALTTGSVMIVAGLTFASVLREGLEVVLFYAALGSRYTAIDLAWSGIIGFLASAALVALIMRGVWKVDLQKFFGITGILLVLVAAGLLVHSVMAMTDLGILSPAPGLWDTSGLLPDDSVTGRVLHALAGYTSTPSLLQATLYLTYLVGVGGWYLHSLGAFHHRTAKERQVAWGRVAIAGAAVTLVLAAVAIGAADPSTPIAMHSHNDGGDDHAHEATTPTTTSTQGSSSEGTFTGPPTTAPVPR
ncbi:MAG: FTR1 family protein [Candidatus Thermoplasmatota archaeon]